MFWRVTKRPNQSVVLSCKRSEAAPDRFKPEPGRPRPTDACQIFYKCTGYYVPAAEGTLAWNDPDIGIDWPIKDPNLSKRDSAGMSLKKYSEKPAFTYARLGEGRDR